MKLSASVNYALHIPRRTHQLSRRAGPNLLNRAGATRLGIHNIEDNSSRHYPTPILLGAGAELADLTALAMNGQNGHARLVEDVEEVAAALEPVLHGTNQIAHSILNRHFGKQTATATAGTALKRSVQMHRHASIRADDVHFESTITAAAIAMAALRLLNGIEIGHLGGATLAIGSGEVDRIAVLRFEAGEHLKHFHLLFHVHTTN